MAYLTQADYEARFGDLEIPQVIESAPEQTIEAAIADAESIINGYLAAMPLRTFVVPLAIAIPSRIKELTADLARYELHSRKVTHEIKRRRDQAIAFLEAMVRGLVAIPELLPDAGAIPVVFESGAEAWAEPRVFTTETLAGYLGR